MIKYISAFLLSALMSVSAFSADEYTAGKHYDLLKTPVTTRDAKKVEVVEVFWYGCIHCFNFEPMMQAWKKAQAADVDVYTMPAMWNANMKMHAKAFYTAKALGKFDQMNDVLFQTMNVKRNRLKTEASVKSVFVANGVDAKKFDATFNSFGVKSQVNLADSRAKSYGIQGTPEIVVNGKYRVSSVSAGGQAQMLKVVEFLIAKERATLAK
ncbi:MAG: thiol:disulfide interchange protein DsbA/DsbL [Sinobacterium sp.]|nr:thiol:disulfide interchange protein DsbA/DsbL [Sinobacterium sp.]